MEWSMHDCWLFWLRTGRSALFQVNITEWSKPSNACIIFNFKLLEKQSRKSSFRALFNNRRSSIYKNVANWRAELISSIISRVASHCINFVSCKYKEKSTRQGGQFVLKSWFDLFWLFLCLTPLSAIFQLYYGDQF